MLQVSSQIIYQTSPSPDEASQQFPAQWTPSELHATPASRQLPDDSRSLVKDGLQIPSPISLECFDVF